MNDRARWDTPPDPSRWYVEMSPLPFLSALLKLWDRYGLPASEYQQIASRTQCATQGMGARVRVYFDGSAYVGTDAGQDYVADWGELWPAHESETWCHFKALAGQAGGAR